jgi:hypothetical protein
MPSYNFKCQKCKKITELNFPLRVVVALEPKHDVGSCAKCNEELTWGDVQIEFQGAINMNASSMGLAQRKYSNKAGGPRPFVDGKLKNEMRPKW